MNSITLPTLESNKNPLGCFYGYIRLSTPRKTIEKQLENINIYSMKNNISFKEIVIDQQLNVSVTTEQCEQYELTKLLNNVQEGDTIVVNSLALISNDFKNLIEIISDLQKRKIKLISLAEQLDITKPNGYSLLDASYLYFNFERDRLFEARFKGIERAKLAGKYKGRQATKKPDNFNECLDKYLNASPLNPYTYKQFMDETKIKSAALDRFIKEAREAREATEARLTKKNESFSNDPRIW
jgi:DNA invertase Pin-like site-specific DNA recombinase